MPTAADRLILALDWLRHRVLGEKVFPPVPQALLILIVQRLDRLHRRLVVLIGKIRAGALPPPRVRPRRQPGAADPPQEAPPRPLAVPFPREWAWLVLRFGYHAAGVGRTVETLLQDPELQGMIAAAPQMGRLLRPLCRALAVRTIPEVLKPPRRTPRPPPARTSAVPRRKRRRDPAMDLLRAAWEAPARLMFPITMGLPESQLPPLRKLRWRR